MTESIGQRCCIKSCRKLGNNQTETIQKIKQAFRDEALSQTQKRNGLITSKMVECQWRVSHVLASHPQAKQGGD